MTAAGQTAWSRRHRCPEWTDVEGVARFPPNSRSRRRPALQDRPAGLPSVRSRSMPASIVSTERQNAKRR